MIIFALRNWSCVMKELRNSQRWLERLSVYNQALRRLSDVVALSSKRKLNEFERDSLIKRFEFTFEMGWKLMMSYEKENGIVQILGSRDVVRQAVSMALVDNGEAWMDMIDARNRTAHLYDEDAVVDIVDDIIYTYSPLLLELQSTMENIKNQLLCTD